MPTFGLMTLKKAEMSDGKRGLSFDEQAELLEKLGYDEPLMEGEKFKLGVGEEYNSNKPTAYLEVGDREELIDEQTLRDYLGR